MDLFRCSRCKNDLPAEAFKWNSGSHSKDGRQGYCIECNRAYQRERGHIYRQRGKERYLAFMADKICIDCGSSGPLDWHHLDPETKLWDVGSRALLGSRWETIMAEIEKCVTLCKPCHRKRHDKSC